MHHVAFSHANTGGGVYFVLYQIINGNKIMEGNTTTNHSQQSTVTNKDEQSSVIECEKEPQICLDSSSPVI